MSFAKVHSAQTHLLDSRIVDVEVDLAKGLHAFAVVGLPDKAVEESRDRVAAAIKNSGFTSPKSKNQKVVISLAPAELKKEGPLFDVPIALAYLLAAKDITFDPAGRLFVGELSLDGFVRPIRGTLAIAEAAKASGFKEIFVPAENAREAALVSGITVIPAATLSELIEHLDPKHERVLAATPETALDAYTEAALVDFGDVRGQDLAKRGLLIAAAGRHNIVLYGPPGTGKTMLARAFRGILPQLSRDEALEVTRIHSIAGALDAPIITAPPFRAPHHTASYVSLVGGGTHPKPGEITLAHRGVLFLDEFPEFERRTIDALREPLEERRITVSRAQGTGIFPADFILVAAMNPAPGGDGSVHPLEQARYERKVSGPIVDRIDMWIEVGEIAHRDLADHAPKKESAAIREKVIETRAIQAKRFGTPSRANSGMSVRGISAHAKLERKAGEMLEDAAGKLKLSPRSYHRVIKLARTIADLEAAEQIAAAHILEALQYRPKMRAY